MPAPDPVLAAAARTAWTLTRLAIVLAATIAGWVVVVAILRRIARRLKVQIGERLLRRCRSPLGIVIAAVAGLIAVPALPELRETVAYGVTHGLQIALIAGCAWLGTNLVRVAGDTAIARHPMDVADNYAARSLRTQISVIERIATVAVIFIGIAVALMTFPQVRAIGASLLASAGIAGLVIGLAARPVLENLLAGLQLALTRPINLDDVVVIDGYWGRIEEITTTYVVLKVWDERRLVLPFSRIISSPFENWTRRHSQIMGTAYLYADYRVPVDELRSELERICKSSPDWDGRVCGLVVTDATEHALQLRALVSASDSGRAWNLRCEVREKLIAYLQQNHPHCLPRTRIAWGNDEARDSATPG